MSSKVSEETRKKETSRVLNCNTSTMRIERSVKNRKHKTGEDRTKTTQTVYGVPGTVTYTVAVALLTKFTILR